MKDVYILAIESSCDETSIAIIKNGCEDIASGLLIKRDACLTTEINIDLIDFIIECVKSKGGIVLLLPENSLVRYNHMVAFTRF